MPRIVAEEYGRVNEGKKVWKHDCEKLPELLPGGTAEKRPSK
jgi:hypothetical protein